MTQEQIKELYKDIVSKYGDPSTVTANDSEYLFDELLFKKYLHMDPHSIRVKNIKACKEYLFFDELKPFLVAGSIVARMYPEYSNKRKNMPKVFNALFHSNAIWLLHNVTRYSHFDKPEDTMPTSGEYYEYREYMRKVLDGIQA